MLERFIREYSQRAFQFAYRLCGNTEQAKELVQEAFVRVICKWDQYDLSQSLENWFLTILRNVYYDNLKRFERRSSISLDSPCGDEDESMTLAETIADPNEPSLLVRLEREEAKAEVREVLESLSPEYKAILALCDMQALSYEQIAAVLDCPLGTVRSRLCRARTAFKKKFLEKIKGVKP